MIFSFGNKVSKSLNETVLTVYYAFLKQKAFLDEWKINDLVPSYNALAFYFTPDDQNFYIKMAKACKYIIDDALKEQTPSWLTNSNHWNIDVNYGGHDLARVALYTGLSEQDVIKLHSERTYDVAMLGFVPFFPYLLGLNPKLAMPRRKRPRVRVNKGSVAIAEMQAGIYSASTPGGWNIIGVTEFDLFESLKPGDTLKFNEVF